MFNDAIQSSAAGRAQRPLGPIRTITSAEDLHAIRALAFFFSPARAELRIPVLSPASQQQIARRLGRLQSVCGCGPATAALAAGIIYGVLGHWGTWPTIGWSVCLAAVAKFATVGGAYAGYRLQIGRLYRVLKQSAR